MPIPRCAALALALAAALSVGNSFAADASHDVPEACRSDAASLCPGVSGEHKLRKCMKQHHDKVSAGCRTAIKHAKAVREGANGASGAVSGNRPEGRKTEGRDGEGPDDD